GEDEGLGEGRLLVGDAEKVLVGDDDQRVDVLADLADADLGDAHAPRTLEVERLRHDADSEDTELFGGAGDHRGGASAGAAAHAGGDEHHVRAGDLRADLV